jgi:hypothetical protein
VEDFTQPLADKEFLVKLGGSGFSPLASLPVQLHEGVHYVRGKVDGP